MVNINNGNIAALLKAAVPGPFMQAEIISLTGYGKLRVTCNWLYSALNCDPRDESTFLWQFNKIDDERISLSPVTSCISKPIYASVRDDDNYYLQVQAPFSADWITAVARDEEITFTLADLSIAHFEGFTGKLLTLNNEVSNHGSHQGYRVRSVGNTLGESSKWFVGIKNCLQSGIQFSGAADIDSVNAQLTRNGVSLQSDVAKKIKRHIETI